MSTALTVLDKISSARVALDGGPLTARTLRAVEILRSESMQERLTEGAIGRIANLVLGSAGRGRVEFREVTCDADFRRVLGLRRRWYPEVLPYLMNELEADGRDGHDRHSFVYAAFLGDRAVGTIRATCYPYETLNHLGESELSGFLGAAWKTEYLEWGRLLVEPGLQGLRVTPALITYAGLHLLLLTPYRRYFGYTKHRVREMVSGLFSVEEDAPTFEIPSRGSHQYVLMKGNIGTTAVHEVPKWARRAAERIVPHWSVPRSAGRMAHAAAR